MHVKSKSFFHLNLIFLRLFSKSFVFTDMNTMTTSLKTWPARQPLTFLILAAIEEIQAIAIDRERIIGTAPLLLNDDAARRVDLANLSAAIGDRLARFRCRRGAPPRHDDVDDLGFQFERFARSRRFAGHDRRNRSRRNRRSRRSGCRCRRGS